MYSIPSHHQSLAAVIIVFVMSDFRGGPGPSPELIAAQAVEAKAKKLPDVGRVIERETNPDTAATTPDESVEPLVGYSETTAVHGGLELLRSHMAEYLSHLDETSEGTTEEPAIDLRAELKKLFPEAGASFEQLLAIEGLVHAVRDGYVERIAEDPDMAADRAQFFAEFGDVLALAQIMEKTETSAETDGDKKRPPTLSECLEGIKKFLAKKLVGLTVPEEEQGEETTEEDADDIFDDEESVLKTSEEKKTASSEAVPETAEEITVVEKEFVFKPNQEVLWEDPFTVVTQESKQIERWQKMLTQELVRGRIERTSAGAAILHIDFQPLPWFATGRKEFVAKNRKYDELFPGAFERIRQPGTDGEYLPEPIFFDRTGKAMNMFLAGRFDEYEKSSEYRKYLLKREEE